MKPISTAVDVSAVMLLKKLIEFAKLVFDGPLVERRSPSSLRVFFGNIGFCGVDDGSARFRLSTFFDIEPSESLTPGRQIN
jgi:hypothetical protein